MSFRRAKGKSASIGENDDETTKISGVKPWINGGYLVSTGNRKLDELLGGGQGIGTALMVENDSFSNYGESILMYSMAQALSSGHKVLVLTDYHCSAENIASMLPYNQNVGRSSTESQPVTGSSAESVVEQRSETGSDNKTAENNAEETRSTEEDSGLLIAWQYKKYFKKGTDEDKLQQQGTAEKSTQYCCSFDLSRRLQPSIWHSNPPEVFSILDSNDKSLEQKLRSMRAAVVAFLAKQQPPHRRVRDSSVGSVVSVSRIFIPQLANLASNYGFSGETVKQIVQFVMGIKQLVRDVHATLSFTLQPLTCADILISRLKWTADTVLSVDSFAGREQSVPYEFKEFQGLLTVERVQQVGTVASFKPPGSKFGLKRDSRKLHVEPLHLPPEESRTGTSGTAAANAAAVSKEGYAAVSALTPIRNGNKKIEVQLDNSTVEVVESPIAVTPLASESPQITSNVHQHSRSASKYEEKGRFDDSKAIDTNPLAKNIFSRARAEGLLPRSLAARAPPLIPGSACASKPGSNDTASKLDF